MIVRKFILLVGLLLTGLANCHADTVELVVDQSQSSVEFEVVGAVETSSLTGTGSIELSPGSKPFGQVQMTALDLNVADGFEFSLFLGLVTISTDPNESMLFLATPGPAATVNADNQFDQLANLIALTGMVNISDPLNLAGGSMVFDLGSAGPAPFDLIGGQLSVAGETLTVELPVAIDVAVTPDVSVNVVASIVLTGELTPFVIGDVNCDGAVNLLDVNPFLDALISTSFTPKADINQDGAVNLLDVDGFVDLLVGG